MKGKSSALSDEEKKLYRNAICQFKLGCQRF